MLSYDNSDRGTSVRLSAIVCTRNRSDRLCTAVARLAASLRKVTSTVEIVVVDNGSIDDTRAVLREAASRVEVPMRVVVESRAGLSYARNAGVTVARGDLLAFVDDDIYVAESWASEILRSFIEFPNLELLAGKVLPARAGLQPIGFLELNHAFLYESKFQCFEPMGASFVVRAGVFREIGDFDVRLGAGRYFASGEDTDFFYRALAAGYQMRYAPSVVAYHDHDRGTVMQSCALVRGYGRGMAGFLWKHLWQMDADALRMTYWCSAGIVGAAIRQSTQSEDEFARSRARCRGYLAAFFPAMLTMWQRSGRSDVVKTP